MEFGTLVLCRPLVISFVDLVEILHGGGGGDVEWWLEPRNKLLVFAIGFLILLHFTFLSCDTSCCTSLLLPFHSLAFFWSLLISTRKQLCASTHNLEELKRRSSRALHGKFDFNFLFWVTGCIIHTYLFKKIIRLALTPIHPPSRCFSIGIRALVSRLLA